VLTWNYQVNNILADKPLALTKGRAVTHRPTITYFPPSCRIGSKEGYSVHHDGIGPLE
jgi:hypothetical protein